MMAGGDERSPKVLIAEDDFVSRRALEATLTKWGYETVVTGDGQTAWEVLRRDDAPRLAVLDWMMPGLDGAQVCRLARSLPAAEPTYILLLTARNAKADVVAGLDAGADDYVTKPFDRDELHARLRVGLRVLALQRALAARVRELEDALSRVQQLQGLLPICSYCKRIRDDGNYWQRLEAYFTAHSAARFSHGICPECFENVVKPQLK